MPKQLKSSFQFEKVAKIASILKNSHIFGTCQKLAKQSSQEHKKNLNFLNFDLSSIFQFKTC